MTNQQPKTLTAPVSTAVAIFLLWLIGLHWMTNETIGALSIIALFIAITPPIWIAAGRLDEQICQAAHEQNEEWWAKADARANRNGKE